MTSNAMRIGNLNAPFIMCGTVLIGQPLNVKHSFRSTPLMDANASCDLPRSTTIENSSGVSSTPLSLNSQCLTVTPIPHALLDVLQIGLAISTPPPPTWAPLVVNEPTPTFITIVGSSEALVLALYWDLRFLGLVLLFLKGDVMVAVLHPPLDVSELYLCDLPQRNRQILFQCCPHGHFGLRIIGAVPCVLSNPPQRDLSNLLA